MTQANDGILVTPGASGADVATRLIGAREHQLVLPADESGHVLGSKPSWVASTGNTLHVAAARTTLIDLFNAVGSGLVLRVHTLLIIPAQAAVTGVGMTYEAMRTTAAGTGGTAITPGAMDTADPTPAAVSARTKPTGGATGTVARRARSITMFARSCPPYLMAPSLICTITGLRSFSAVWMIAWVISMLLVLNEPTPYLPARAGTRMSLPVTSMCVPP